MSDASNAGNRLYGFMSEFEDPGEFVGACRQVRDAGFRRWDAFSPFPIHGMDRAMGIRPTKLPFLVLGAGLTGLGLALLMQWWMNAVDYPFLISGKPLFGLPANIPVTFELTVLFAALTTFFGMWTMNGMPRLHHPLFGSESFRRVTADRFFIVIEADDPAFDGEKTRAFLAGLGGKDVEAVEDE